MSDQHRAVEVEEPGDGSYVVARWGPGISLLWHRDDRRAAFLLGRAVAGELHGEGEFEPVELVAFAAARWILRHRDGRESLPVPWGEVATTPPRDRWLRELGIPLSDRAQLMLAVPVDTPPGVPRPVDLDDADTAYLYPHGDRTLPAVVATRAVELVKRARAERDELAATVERVAELAAAPAGYSSNREAYVLCDDVSELVRGPSWRSVDPRMLATAAHRIALAVRRMGRRMAWDAGGMTADLAAARIDEASDELDQLPPLGRKG